MAIIYRTTGAWGAGKGSPLTAAEVDGNFYDLDQRVDDLEINGVQPNNIASIQVIGSQMTIFMDDYSTFGPFTLPISILRWRGNWAPDEDYDELDLFYVVGQGLYMVLLDHTSDPYTFDENDTNVESSPYYFKIFATPGFQTYYDIPIWYPGQPGNGALMFKHITPRPYTLSSTLSVCPVDAGTLPTDSDVSFDVHKNGVSIGTIELFTGGGFFLDIAADVDFLEQDVLEVFAPSPQDSTLADISITIDGIRDNVGI